MSLLYTATCVKHFALCSNDYLTVLCAANMAWNRDIAISGRYILVMRPSNDHVSLQLAAAYTVGECHLRCPPLHFG